MVQIIRNISLLLLPFLIMVVVNEISRTFVKEKPWEYKGIHTINSLVYDNNKCTWACHNSTTNHCLKKHTNIIKPGFPFFESINEFYWGIINFNSKKINGKKVSDPRYYAAMNIIFLVLLWPLTMYCLLINYLRLRKKQRLLYGKYWIVFWLYIRLLYRFCNQFSKRFSSFILWNKCNNILHYLAYSHSSINYDKHSKINKIENN